MKPSDPNEYDASEVISRRAVRRCPRCEAPDEITDNSNLWPHNWSCKACGFSVDCRDGFVRLAPQLDDVDEGFSLSSYESLRAMEDGHFWFSTRNEMITWLVRRFAREAKRVLEIGCGTGYVLFALRKALPTARLAGSELHSRGLVHARHRHRGVELLQMDARKSGLSDSLDLVGAFDVLEHIPDDEAVLREIHRMLKPGGVLIATVPQHPWLWSAVDEVAHHQRRYRVGELAAKAQAAGLQVIYRTSFAALSLPLMMVDRWRARKLAGDAVTDARVSRGTNAALTTVFHLEQVLRRFGFPLPIGGSQVLVATKAMHLGRSNVGEPL
jgi:SAM-dependent methyltransferase